MIAVTLLSPTMFLCSVGEVQAFTSFKFMFPIGIVSPQKLDFLGSRFS